MAHLPIVDFLKSRLKEWKSDFEVRDGTGFEQLFMEPMELITQPFYDDAAFVHTSQSFLRILKTDDPDSYDEESVDSLLSNIIVDRRQGGYSSGVARVCYNDPSDKEWPATGIVFTSKTGKTYNNPNPFSITKSEMSLQLDDGLYYVDIPIKSDDTGLDTIAEINEIISLAGDDDVVRVYNPGRISGGLDKETNTEAITRAQESVGERSLTANRGIKATLFNNFKDTIDQIDTIGFGDKEMMRDIVYNTHIGGKVDVFIKTASVSEQTSDFIGLLPDTTRQAKTSKNVVMKGASPIDLGNPNVDRSGNNVPSVTEVKVSTSAIIKSNVNLLSPINLSSNQYIKIGIDGVFKNIRVAGVIPATTSRTEVLNLINNAFGVNVAFTNGASIKILSPTSGLSSQVVIDNPDAGTSALYKLFASQEQLSVNGDGPVVFIEGTHYSIDDSNGTIKRVVGETIISLKSTGQVVEDSDRLLDGTPGVFALVLERDIVSFGNEDYRVLEKISDNELVLDSVFAESQTDLSYSIARTGIKNNETVFVQYYFNPLSIDIGKYCLSSDGSRGIRTGREEFTITNLPVLKIKKIMEIDPLTLEETGVELIGYQGYGRGGYGRGGYGRGQGGDWCLIVNSPSERFSMFEDSYIIFNSGYSGLSFRIYYDTCADIETYHDFCRSDSERNLNGDILVKHHLPVYVSGTIYYKIDSSYSDVVTNDALTTLVKNHINAIKSTYDIDYSDLTQFITSTLDPYKRYGTSIKTFVLTGEIHNCDGTVNIVTGEDKLSIEDLNPFPKQTNRPLSAKMCRWIASDSFEIVRL